MSLILPRSAFKVLEGDLKTWQTRSAQGNVKRAHFCPLCGVRIFHDGGETSATITVKAGTLDDAGWVAPELHIWCAEKLPWTEIPEGATQAPGNPG